MSETKTYRILFQGDSITDVGRARNDPRNMGQGYPVMVAGELGLRFPGKYEFINRGISGDRIPDLVARFGKDFVHLKPDVISILVGVNDVWHEPDVRNGVDERRFRNLYRMLLEDLFTALREPSPKIILMEPFFLPGSATEPMLEYFGEEIPLRAAAVRDLAKEFSLPFIPLQEKFNELTKLCPPSYWLMDGVHPTPAGHRMIAEEWMKVFETFGL